jgi:hypothetical protein
MLPCSRAAQSTRKTRGLQAHALSQRGAHPEAMNPILVERTEQVACPKCNQRFPLSEGLSRQAIERRADAFEKGLAERRRKLEAELAAEAKAKAEVELRAKDAALEKFRAEELQLRRRLHDLEEAKKNVDVDYQRKLDEEMKRRDALYQAQIASAQREVADLKRKLEQGSQQLQGEALELSLESVLKSAFPLDEIVPVPKGMNGADLLQHVRLPSGYCCGTIVWEAKQTKAWQPAWLQKLKDDQHAIGAELAVIVTAAMPKDPSGKSEAPFVREADVWVARFDAARPLAGILRAHLLELHKARQANLGRAENAERIYNYICSPQFMQRFKASREAIAAMQADLDAEKAAMARLWKKRESQLERMDGGLLAVVGDLQGIGQDGLPQLDTIAALPALSPP